MKESWLTEFPWAGVENGELFCKVCREYPELSDKDSTLVKGIREKYRKETLKYHNKSAKHIKCIEKKQVLENPTKAPLAKSTKILDEKNSVTYEKLFNTAYYIAKENESFAKYPSLLELQKKNGVVIGSNYLNDKSCKQFCVSTSETLKDETIEDLRKARFVSVLSDGSTDKGIVEQELVYVRYISQSGELKTRLADVVNLEHGHAEGVKNGILKGLESVGLATEDLSEKLIGINTDGASVNLGKKGGAVKLLMDSVNEHLDDHHEKSETYMAVVHCIAHNLELAVCDVKKGCAYLDQFETVLKGIFKLYYYSPKRRRELYEIAVSLDQDLKHYGGVQQVRWVASQNRAQNSLLENYELTVVHLQDIASTSKDESAQKAKGFLTAMRTERFLTFLHFMIDWTNLLSDVSVLFQEKKCLISEVGERVVVLKEKFGKMKDRRGKVLRKFLRETKDTDGQYRGTEITQRDRRNHTDTPEQINADIDELLSSAEVFLEERFVKHLGGEPHSLFNVFNFRVWPSKDISPEEFRSYGDEEIEKLLSIYSPKLEEDERESGLEEWFDLKMEICKNLNRSVIDAYESLIRNVADLDHLIHILPLVKIMLTISPSTAECERGFSQLNRIKTESRTSLKQDTMSSLMRIALDGPMLKDFQPTQSIVKWLNSGKGTKHLKGHKCPGPRKSKTSKCPSSSNSDESGSDHGEVSTVE